MENTIIDMVVISTVMSISIWWGYYIRDGIAKEHEEKYLEIIENLKNNKN